MAEAWRNICATGAKPLAVTNNLNFGNPEKQDIMAQIVGSVNGMGKACKVLNTPVVSGNVSLYNETDGEAIQPCPVIGMVGLIDNWKHAVGAGFTAPDKALFIIGQTAEMTDGWLGNSVFARVIAEREGGAPVFQVLQALLPLKFELPPELLGALQVDALDARQQLLVGLEEVRADVALLHLLVPDG